MVIKIFRKWGFFIAEHAILAIILCVLLSIGALVKVVLTK